MAGKRFTKVRRPDRLFPVVVFHHETPLIRNLPKAELWLQQNKIRNLTIAVGKMDGLILKPGKVFSFWLMLGKPTKAKGYVEGFVLNDGKVEPGIGGGLCQLSNLIYWMTLHTPLNVIERWRHNYDVFPDTERSVPFGSGATCAFPFLDLQVSNPTAQPVQLHLKLTASHLSGQWRSIHPYELTYQIYESFHEFNCDYQGRYLRRNILRRKVFKDQLQVNDEFITENHALMMYQPLLTVCKTEGVEGVNAKQ